MRATGTRERARRSAAADPTPEGVIILTALGAIPEVLRELGVEPGAVLAAAGIESARLQDPHSTIPFTTMGRLAAECAALTGCPHFGLLVGGREGLPALGLVGFLVQHSPDVGTGLRNLVAHIRHFQRGAVTTLSTDEGTACLGFDIYLEQVEGQDQIYDGAIAVYTNVMRALCGPTWRPSEVAFAHGRPADLRPYQRFFGAPLRFDAERNCVAFPGAWLDQPIPGAEPMLYQILQRQVDALDEDAGAGFASAVRGIVRTLLVGNRCSVEEAAAVFGIHRRTLHRRLKREGVTFDALVEGVRAELAKELLAARQTPLSRVASTLGYADVSAFSRAFRRWFGTTPARWRSDNGLRRPDQASP
jgi:AraC-like DNA-binding protein